MSDSSAPLFQAPSAEALAPLFPHYEILDLIACGGMGAVYRARQASLDRIVAVKILPPELGADVEYAKRFQAEARLMANLSNPHIVTVFDFGMAGSYLYFVMEYVDGKTLHDLLADGGPMNYESCLRAMAEVCRGLDYAHEKGLVHLDIKPGNIMINREGEARVLDFGLAKLLDPRKGSATETMGTPEYAAPERLQDGAKVDHRADIYSLGIMFYELLTGKIPRGAFTPASKVVAVDPGVDAIISKCTKSNPTERYGKAREIFGELVRLRRNAASWKSRTKSVGVAQSAGGTGGKKAQSDAVTAYQEMMAGKGSKGWVGWMVAVVALAVIVGTLIASGVFGGDDPKRTKGGKEKGGGMAGIEREWKKPPRDRPEKPDRPGKPNGGGGDSGGGELAGGNPPDGGVDPPEKPEKERYPFPPDGLAEEIDKVRLAMVEKKPLEELELEHLRIHEGRAYYLIPRRLSWKDAGAFADENGAHLASITSEEEEQFVRQTWFDSSSESRGSRPVWIGAQQGEDGWIWVSGEEWGYEDWRDREDAEAKTGEPVAAVMHEVSWVSRSEETSYSALIEWDPPKEEMVEVPEPGPVKPDVPERILTPLEKLRKGFEDRMRSDVVGVRAEEMRALGEKYLGALEALFERLSSTPVQEALVGAEIQRYKAERTPPAEADRWPELGNLQNILITQSKKIDQTAMEKRSQLIRTYGDALLGLQADFTSRAQWDQVELAKKERERIEGLKTEEGFGVVVAVPKGIEELAVLVESDKTPRFVAAIPDGRRYLVSGRDGMFRVFSSEDGEMEIEWEAGHEGGRCAFLPGGDRFVAIGYGGHFGIWSLSQRVALFSEEETAGMPVRLAVSPSGDACVVGMTTYKEPKEPGEAGVRPWALSDPPVKGDFNNKAAQSWAAFSPGGKHLAMSTRKGLGLVVYGETEPLWTNTDCKGEAVVFSRDGKKLICGRLIVDVETGETLNDLRLTEPERFLDEDEERGAWVNALALDEDGIHVVFGLNGGGIEIWNLETSKRIFELEDAHSAVMASVSFSMDGMRLATADVGGAVKLWTVIR